jgi:NADH-quinone oxidoreductase subunit E
MACAGSEASSEKTKSKVPGYHPQRPGINNIIKKHRRELGSLLAILDEVQEKYGVLSAGAINDACELADVPLADVLELVPFYKAFRRIPRRKHLVSVCLGASCHIRGAPDVVSEFEKRLGIKVGGTTPDGKFTLETANCFGSCALGPIVVVDGYYFSDIKITDVRDIINMTRAGLEKAGAITGERMFPGEVICPHCSHTLMDRRRIVDGHPSIRVTAAAALDHGSVRFSSLYGNHSMESEFPIPSDEEVHFFCPHCHGELASSNTCADCGAPTVSMMMCDGSALEICSRKGCSERKLFLSALNVYRNNYQHWKASG